MSDITLTKSVRTNLLSLQNTAQLMAKTQERLATGKKVNSALDNPTNFFTASALNSRAGDMASLLDSMANGVKTIEAANNGLTSITKTVESMQSTLRQARQDKSFQTATYDVTKDSVLSLTGGQFGALTDVKLGTATPGTAAAVTGSVAYAGPTVAGAGALGEGAGARSIISLDAVTDLAGKSIKVDGKTVAFAASDNTLALVQAKLNSALGTDDYAVSNVGNDIIIENTKVTGYASTSPVVDLGSTAATKANVSFQYDPAALGANITIDGSNIVVGGTASEFAASLKTQLGDSYSVGLDTGSNTITVTNNTAGAGTVDLSGGGFGTKSTSSFELDTTNAQNLSFGGATLALGAGDTDADVIAKFQANANLNNAYTITNTGSGQFTVTAKVNGSAPIAVSSDDATAVSNLTQTSGNTATVTLTQVAGIAGTTVKNEPAASHELTIVYDNKTAKIKVTGSDSASIAKSINDQLKTAGLDNVAASFDADGHLSIASKSAEAKALTITGPQADAIFGAATAKNGTGTDTISGYNSKNVVDQFVEEINRNAKTAGLIRASNDNGKLRIENLSTLELDVVHDADGDGPASSVSSKIAGNSVRASLAKQFNELRDQLDKLADDASFNGINLLRGDQLTITFNENGSSSIKVQAKDNNGNTRSITAANLDIASLISTNLDTDDDIDGLLSKLSNALGTLRSQASSFGSNLSSVENRQNFTKSMINTLQSGADNLTLADMNEEAANLLALQTRQSLSSSALSMASQADQSVLQLLR